MTMNEIDCIIQIETVKNVQTIKGGERMLLEERLDEIVKIVNERGSISNQELVKMLGASESTIRRDITTLPMITELYEYTAVQCRLYRAEGWKIRKSVQDVFKTVMKKSKSQNMRHH